MNGEWEEFEDLEELYEDDLGADLEDPFLGSFLKRVPWKKLARVGTQAVLRGGTGRILSGLLPESDLESDYEEYLGESEADYEYDLMGEAEEMEALAEEAAEAETEAESDAFIGAILSTATKLLPKAISIGRRVLPRLIGGATRLARTLRRSPATRQLVRTIPTIARHTVRSLARQVAAGKPITSSSAVRTMARQTARVLGSPRRAGACVHRSRRVARRVPRRWIRAAA